jgi:hypothetical protein
MIIAASVSLIPILLPATVNAQASAKYSYCNSNFFLTIPAWYNGINKSTANGCEIASPQEVGGFSVFIWKIVLNIVEIMLNLVGYASVAFIIYGGYKYMYSAGSPDGMVKARKTIMNAVVGLVLSILSVAIVNTISGSLR